MKHGRRNSSRRPQSRKKKQASGNEGFAFKPDGPVRLNKYIAQAGICARRKADELIKEGRVKINGKVVVEMGVKVSDKDVVEVNGNRITPLSHDYILVNKPKDVITSNNDEKDRRIILDLIDDDGLKQRGLFPVGRLDRNTLGVLLMTNDGELAHRLMHPRYEIRKLYAVKTKKKISEQDIERLSEGIEIEGEMFQMDEVAYLSASDKKELGISLHEGKNRHIRRMLEAIGHEVVRLERVRYAGLTTKDVRPGKWRRLSTNEVKRLRRIVKLR